MPTGGLNPRKALESRPARAGLSGGGAEKFLFYYWVDLNLSLPRCDLVYTVSQDMKRKLLRGRTAEKKIRVVYTGLEPKELDTPLSRDLARKKLGLPVDGFVLGVVGRLSGEKGHLVLVDAGHRLAERVPQLHALFIGDGYMRSVIEARAAELSIAHRVHLAGYVMIWQPPTRQWMCACCPAYWKKDFPPLYWKRNSRDSRLWLRI